MRRVEWVGGEPVVREAPDPEPGPRELLVEVTRAGVTLPVVRAGDGGQPPGGDVVGRVLAGGADAGRWEPGTRVAGIAAAGAYAERTVLPTRFAAAVPEDVSDDAAVTLVRGGQVALGALRAGGAGRGLAVLVTAAAGGVGHLAVQLARTLGASRVVAAVGPSGPAERAGMLAGLGATEVVAYPDLDGVEPVDVVLDGAGGPALQAALGTLGLDGRLVVYNGVGGPVETNHLRRQGQSLVGFAMARLVARDPGRYLDHRALLWAEAAIGRLRAVVHGPFGFDEAAAAHALLRERRNVGKVVLAP